MPRGPGVSSIPVPAATSTATTTVARSTPAGPAARPTGSAAGARLPATFELAPGGSLSPPTVSGPGQVAVQLTFVSSDSSPHQVVLGAPHPVRLGVPAHGRATAEVTGLGNGRYPITVDGVKRGSLVIGSQPGP